MKNNVTTYQTSLELEANGFPQPEKAFGQIWYARKDYNGLIKAGERLVCIQALEEGNNVFASESGGHVVCSNKLDLVYAARDADVLRELSDYPSVQWSGEKFYVHFFGEKNWDIDGHDTHRNPAEACAQAWLKIQKK